MGREEVVSRAESQEVQNEINTSARFASSVMIKALSNLTWVNIQVSRRGKMSRCSGMTPTSNEEERVYKSEVVKEIPAIDISFNFDPGK